jgi:subtilisin family serine protease
MSDASLPGIQDCGKALTYPLGSAAPDLLVYNFCLALWWSVKGAASYNLSLLQLGYVTLDSHPCLLQNNRRSPGRDINVTGVWERNVTGRGVTVVVVDDGVEHTIQDIAPNYVSGLERPHLATSLLPHIASVLFPFIEAPNQAKQTRSGGGVLPSVLS